MFLKENKEVAIFVCLFIYLFTAFLDSLNHSEIRFLTTYHPSLMVPRDVVRAIVMVKCSHISHVWTLGDKWNRMIFGAWRSEVPIQRMGQWRVMHLDLSKEDVATSCCGKLFGWYNSNRWMGDGIC
jgi:hypothetical protein